MPRDVSARKGQSAAQLVDVGIVPPSTSDPTSTIDLIIEHRDWRTSVDVPPPAETT
jgi:hypothetical protein